MLRSMTAASSPIARLISISRVNTRPAVAARQCSRRNSVAVHTIVQAIHQDLEALLGRSPDCLPLLPAPRTMRCAWNSVSGTHRAAAQL